jgi:hypothetical protein
MRPKDGANPAGHDSCRDVGTTQANNLLSLPCHSALVSGMVTAGRTQAAFNADRGRAREGVPIIAPQERWSRGCPRAHVSSWCLQWLALLLPVRKKKSPLWLNRFRLNRPTPANTSNGSGQALQHRLTTPAPILRFPHHAAVEAQSFLPTLLMIGICAVWRICWAVAIAPVSDPLRRQDTC